MAKAEELISRQIESTDFVKVNHPTLGLCELYALHVPKSADVIDYRGDKYNVLIKDLKIVE